MRFGATLHFRGISRFQGAERRPSLAYFRFLSIALDETHSPYDHKRQKWNGCPRGRQSSTEWLRKERVGDKHGKDLAHHEGGDEQQRNGRNGCGRVTWWDSVLSPLTPSQLQLKLNPSSTSTGPPAAKRRRGRPEDHARVQPERRWANAQRRRLQREAAWR